MYDDHDLKAELNARSETSMRAFLRAKSWPEKVRSIERMNAAQKIARRAMRAALEKETAARAE